jgi:hypothetical protein
VGTRAFFVQVAFVPVLIMGLMQPSNRHKGFWLLFALSTVMLALVRKRLAELAPASERHPWRAAPAPSPSTPAIQPRAG